MQHLLGSNPSCCQMCFMLKCANTCQLELTSCVSAELFYTERAHVRMLKVLDNVFYQKLTKDSILPPADIKNIFSNLEEVLQLHGTLETHISSASEPLRINKMPEKSCSVNLIPF